MEFTVDFFKDEVRNGFYIPTAIKQAWAANLCVLLEIDRICEKYGITYFADWGSILGAVRHGGYVPWDDDLDICMKREDYNKFRAVADEELPNGFAIHDFRSKEDHWLFLARVVNSNQICFDEEHLNKYHNFPYISVVDIFIKDYLYRDEEKEQERCKEIKKLIAVADGIVENAFSEDTVTREIAVIERDYGVVIDRNLSLKEIGIIIYGIAEQQMARVKENEADNIGQMFPFVLKGDRGLPKEYYDKAIRLPFENTTIPVPACYNLMLRNRYGNYLEIHKIWGGHNYPYFEGQRKNLQAIADFSLPEFLFNPDMIKSVDRKKSETDSLTGMSKSVIGQFSEMHKQIFILLDEGIYDDVLNIMPEIQQFIVDYATLVENVKGEKRKCTIELVEVIQMYCDTLYEVYQELSSANSEDDEDEIATDRLGALVKKLSWVFESVINIIYNNVINRKEILFLTIGPEEWRKFAPIYRRYLENPDCEVYVVPLPTFFKDIYGRIIVPEEDILNAIDYAGYPNELELSLWTEYSLELHRPDVIYIQNPYDGENPCLTIPAQFYSANIRFYTDKLIYVPPYDTGEFGVNDYNDIYNLKHYVTVPGVIYADEVLVQSDNIRNRYIEKLTEFAGEKTGIIWDGKIRVNNFHNNKTNVEDVSNCEKNLENEKNIRKKRLLYCIGFNEMTEHRHNIIDRIKQRIRVFQKNAEAIEIGVTFFPTDEMVWKEADGHITDEIKKLIGSCGWNVEMSVINISDREKIVREYDAYYGSASPLVPLFSEYKKPVMIADYNI